MSRGKGEAVQSNAGKRWLAENAAAINASNRYVEAHGLPLARIVSWKDAGALPTT
ncbi:MAG: type II toxin-antitoxin system CcdA family antitoxin [Sphingomonas sp.]